MSANLSSTTASHEIPFQTSFLLDQVADAIPVKDLINNLSESILSDPAAGKAITDLSNKRLLDETIAMIGGNSYVNPQDPLYYACAFPTLFPLGVGCPNSSRQITISIEDYAKHVLCIRSESFRKNLPFQFTIFDQIRRREIFSSVKLHVRQLSESGLQRLNDISISDLKEALLLKNSGNTISKDHPSKALMDSLRLVGAKTNYSNHFKTNSRSELISCIVHHGSPSLYVTISPLDHRHILAFQICNREIPLDLANLPAQLSESDFRLLQASQNPVSLAQFFHVLTREILQHLFAVGSDSPGIFGTADSYYGMVESQNRGTLHIHMMLWIRNAPSPDVLYAKLCNDSLFKEKLLSYLQSIIKNDLSDFSTYTSLNTPNPNVSLDPLLTVSDLQNETFSAFLHNAIQEYQTHQHMPSCYKNSKTKGNCRYRKPEQLFSESTFDTETGDIKLKRQDPMINSFNPYLTCVANSNTDVAFLFRCIGAMCVIYYITMYITKSIEHVDNYYSLMHAAKQSLSTTPLQSSVSDLTPEQMSARALLLRIYQKINGSIQIPANIVATLLLDLPMSYKYDW